MIGAWKKLVALIRDLVRQGMTPKKIVLTMALGLLISVFPIMGVPTLLCTSVAYLLRLNLPLIQAVNYLGAPLQWLMIVPFLRLGERLTGAAPLPLSPEQVRTAIETQGIGFFGEFLVAGLYAALGWMALCLPLAGLLYFLGRTWLSPPGPSPLEDAGGLCPGP